MGYYRPLKILNDAMPRDAIFVTEGENTMGDRAHGDQQL